MDHIHIYYIFWIFFSGIFFVQLARRSGGGGCGMRAGGGEMHRSRPRSAMPSPDATASDAPAPDAPAPAPVNALITTDLAISLVACHTKTEDRLACDNPFCVRVWNHADSNGASNDHDYLAAPMVRAMRDKGLQGARRTEEDAAASGRRRFRLLRDTGACERVCLACHGANLPDGTTIKTHVICSDCREENAHVCAGGSCLACEVASQLSTAPAPAPEPAEPAEPAAAGRSLRKRPAKTAAKVGRTASRSFQPIVGRALTKSMPAHVCEGVMRVVEEHSKQGANIDAVRAAKDDALRDAEGAQSGKRRRADAIAARKRLQKVVDEEKEALEAFQIACAMKDRAWFGCTREVVLNPLRAEEDEPHFKPCMDDDEEFDTNALDAEDQEGVLEEMGAITLGVDAECLRSIKAAQHDLENPESPTPSSVFQARNKSWIDLRERLDAFRAKAPVTAEKYFGPAPDDDHYSSVDERYGQAYDRLEAALKAYRVTVKETVPDLSVVADEYDGPTPGKRRKTAADPDVPLTAEQQEKKDAADAKKERNKRVRDELNELMSSDVAQELRRQKEQAWKEEYAAEHGEPCVAYDPKKTQPDWAGFDPSVTIREVMDAQREEEAEEDEGEDEEAEDEEEAGEAEAEAEEAEEAGEAGAEAEEPEAEEPEAEAEEPTVLASEYEAYRQKKQAQLRFYQQFLKDRNLLAEFKAYRQSQMVVPE